MGTTGVICFCTLFFLLVLPSWGINNWLSARSICDGFFGQSGSLTRLTQFFSFLNLYLSSVKEEGTGASTGWRTKEVAQTSHGRIKPRQAAVRMVTIPLPWCCDAIYMSLSIVLTTALLIGGMDLFVLARNITLSPELLQVISWVGNSGLPAYVCRITGRMADRGIMVIQSPTRRAYFFVYGSTLICTVWTVL